MKGACGGLRAGKKRRGEGVSGGGHGRGGIGGPRMRPGRRRVSNRGGWRVGAKKERGVGGVMGVRGK